MTSATVTLTDRDWYFVLDSLHDRLENLSDLQNGPFGDMDFTEDIAQCEAIIYTLQNRNHAH